MCDYTGTDKLEVMVEAINYNQFLLSLVYAQARRGKQILDVGAGIGTFAKALVGDGYRVHCIEPDAKQAAVISAAGLPVSAKLSEIEDSSVDYLYTLNVLEHIADDVAALREWHQKLKPGGRMLVYVPAFQVLYSSMDLKIGHLRRYTQDELAEKVRLAGFEVTTMQYVDCAGFLASLLYKVVGNHLGNINRGVLVAYDRFVFPLSRIGDLFFRKFFGKNILLTAIRRAS
jgi:SAM-dependent methyltransferase